MHAENEWSVFRRQPAAAIWLLLLTTGVKLFKAFWPFILVALFSSKRRGAFVAIVFVSAIPLVVGIVAVLKYLYFKYKIEDGQLVIKQGVFKKEQIAIPLNNIQGVNIDQNWLHKIIKLARVAVDSPGTEKAEVKINLTLKTAQTLKTLLLTGNPSAEPADIASAQTNLVSTLPVKDLLKLGISANHLETLLIMFGLGISFFQNIKDVFEDQLEKVIKASEVSLVAGGMLFIVYITLAVLVISVVASFIRIVLKYANFTINKTEKGFSLRGGLINSVEHLVSFDKIQFVSWQANMIRKYIPIFMVEYHSIGIKHLEKQLKVKIPVPNGLLLEKLTAVYSNGIDAMLPHLSISKKYVMRRTLFFGLLPGLFIGGATVFFIGFKVFWLLLLPCFSYLTAYLYYRKFKLYYNSELIHIRKGAYGRSEILLKWNKIQSVELVRGYYQQHNHVADLKLHTAGGLITLPYLNLDDARLIQNYALYQIEKSDSAPWN